MSEGMAKPGAGVSTANYITYITHDGEAIVTPAVSGISVMQIATSSAVPGIDAECGGSLSCATCHVYVDDDWVDVVGPPSDNEKDMLEFAEAPSPTSRLSCQIKFSSELDGLVVRIPEHQ
jgi:ferredoxin, 2Fe-2S